MNRLEAKRLGLVDRERDGFRMYAAHKDGQVALSLDSAGVGFVNYYPSGRTMVSTTSSGDGLYLSPDGAILRLWDVNQNVTDADMGAADLSPVQLKMNDHLGLRFELEGTGTGKSSACAVQLRVFFSCHGIRHVFVNGVNRAEPNGHECDAVLGKEPDKLARVKKAATKMPTTELLAGIRAAVANLP